MVINFWLERLHRGIFIHLFISTNLWVCLFIMFSWRQHFAEQQFAASPRLVPLNHIEVVSVVSLYDHLLLRLDLEKNTENVTIEIRTWICNYIHITGCRDIITHPCQNFNGGLAKPPLKFRHGWVIISHIKQWMWLLIHVLISDALPLASDK